MTERKVCPYCESEYGDDTDAEGNVYCDCDGAMIERQAARIADDELRIAGLQSAIREKNARIAELEAQCDTMGNALLERGCDGVVHECAVLEARIKELEENDHV